MRFVSSQFYPSMWLHSVFLDHVFQTDHLIAGSSVPGQLSFLVRELYSENGDVFLTLHHSFHVLVRRKSSESLDLIL